MSVIYKALIEAIVYLAIVEGSDYREDDDLRVLESIIAELNQATPSEREGLIAAVRAELVETQNQARIDALEAIIDSISN